MLAFLLVGLLIYDLVNPAFSFTSFIPGMSGAGLFAVWLFLMLMTAGWWFYQYLNWSNDIFQVTPDQILDINKTPLGEVTSDIASLDNILHLEYERRGIMALLLNFGNVYITIGGGKEMTFESVYNPSAVQDDIERRRLEQMTRKEQEKIKDDRERMADWFAAYYHNEEKFRQTANTTEAKDIAEDEDPPNLI